MIRALRSTLSTAFLLEAAKAHFPSQPRVDQRISARPDFQASAKYTWNLYAQMKATAKATLPAVRLKWRAAMRFRRASLALRAQSRQLKRQMLLDQMEQASEAADRGDQRTLHLLVRRLAPRSFRGVSRMPGSDGRLLTAPKELEAMVQCGHETFAALPDVDGLCVTDHNLLVTDAAIAVELGKLSLRKAAPCGVYAAPPSARFLGEPCDQHFGCHVPPAKHFQGYCVLREFLLQTLQNRHRSATTICLHQAKGNSRCPSPVHAHFAEVAQLLTQNVG